LKRLATILGIFVLLLAPLAHAQQRWERTYGGAGNEGGNAVRQTQDGGYIVSGGTTSYGNGYQVYLVKTNASGDTLWTRTYGGAGSDEGYSVQQTQDTGYIVSGYTNSFGNFTQVYLIKTNASGDTLWTRYYGGMGEDVGYSAQQTSDGGYVVAGLTGFYPDYQVCLIKTNASGDTLWTKNYGGTARDVGESVRQTTDGGYIIAGYTYSFGVGGDVYLVKTNASGDTLWTRTYGGTDYDEGSSVRQTQDGGYIVSGYTNSFGNNTKVYLIKTNASGDTLWTRTYGGAGGECGLSVQQTSEGGYIVAGWTNSFGNWDQVYLVKTNASGDTLWTRTYGGASYDYGLSVQQTQDGGYIVAGNTQSFGNAAQVYLIKTDANGNVGVEEARNAEFGMRNAELRITPNPFTSFATLPGHETERFALYDIAGRKVGTYKGERIGMDLRPGVYFIRSLEREAGPRSEGRLGRIVKIR